MKAVLALCAARTCRLVLCKSIKTKVERNILKKVGIIEEAEVEQIIENYQGFLKLARPIKIPLAEESRVIANRSLIRHFADVSVVLAAMDATADLIITRNREHFTDEVSRKIDIKIASPGEFFKAIIENF